MLKSSLILYHVILVLGFNEMEILGRKKYSPHTNRHSLQKAIGVGAHYLILSYQDFFTRFFT